MAIQKFVTLSAGNHKLVDGGVQTSAGAGDSGKLPALDSSGRLDSSFLPVGIGADTAAIATSESLSAGKFVNIWNNSGSPAVRLADATTVGKEAHGFVLSSFTHPATATVYFEGSNNSITSAVAGNVFLSTTPGGFTSTAPSTTGNVVQKLGVAVSATTINVEFSDPVELA
jgi:hypothetical protein